MPQIHALYRTAEANVCVGVANVNKTTKYNSNFFPCFLFIYLFFFFWILFLGMLLAGAIFALNAFPCCRPRSSAGEVHTSTHEFLAKKKKNAIANR